VFSSYGVVRCWGNNAFGTIGNGTTTDTSAPVDVSDVAHAIAIAAHHRHSCTATTDDKVQCWSDNASGQLAKDEPQCLQKNRLPWLDD